MYAVRTSVAWTMTVGLQITFMERCILDMPTCARRMKPSKRSSRDEPHRSVNMKIVTWTALGAPVDGEEVATAAVAVVDTAEVGAAAGVGGEEAVGDQLQREFRCVSVFATVNLFHLQQIFLRLWPRLDSVQHGPNGRPCA
jgi:hypothetical protein